MYSIDLYSRLEVLKNIWFYCYKVKANLSWWNPFSYIIEIRKLIYLVLSMILTLSHLAPARHIQLKEASSQVYIVIKRSIQP